MGELETYGGVVDKYVKREYMWFKRSRFDVYGCRRVGLTKLYKYCVAKGWCPSIDWHEELDFKLLRVCMNEREDVDELYLKRKRALDTLLFIEQYKLLEKPDVDGLKSVELDDVNVNVFVVMTCNSLFKSVESLREKIKQYKRSLNTIEFVRKYELREKMMCSLINKIYRLVGGCG